MIKSKDLTIECFFDLPTVSDSMKSIDSDRKLNIKQAYKMTKRRYGAVLEFGVMSGRTLAVLAALNDPLSVYGFDSFEGLPEEWIKNPLEVYPGGSFKTDPAILPENTVLYKGWFKDTIPQWLEDHNSSIKLIHIDCDLYSSTKDILFNLNDRILKGTILVFDEMYNWNNPEEYTEWDQHEFKALKEWMKTFGRRIEPLFRSNHEQVTIRVC